MAARSRTIGIIGAGQMGSGIAHVSALAGYKVLIYDISPERIEKGTCHRSAATWPARSSSGKLDEKAAATRDGAHFGGARDGRSRRLPTW